jgi:hypothetical protein
VSAAEDDPHLLNLWLPALQRWHEETGNPLYVWQALARCLNAQPPAPIPPWCSPYLADAANNMALLSWGKDFRDKTLERRISPDDAKKLVGEALSLWKPKTKNAFARLADDALASRTALDFDDAAEMAERGRLILHVRNGEVGDSPTPADVRERLMRQANVAEDRADRVIRGGRGLSRGKRR